jgi:hypothetical protein
LTFISAILHTARAALAIEGACPCSKTQWSH